MAILQAQYDTFSGCQTLSSVDTLTQWRKTVADLDETAAMTRLLTALRKIVGFEGLADELAQTHGRFSSLVPHMYSSWRVGSPDG